MREKPLTSGSESATTPRGALRLLAAALGVGALIAGLSLVAPVTTAPAEAATPTAAQATAATPAAGVPAAAVTGYNASELMSDEVIFDTTTMSQASIQKFLQDKNPRCSGALCLKNFTVTTRVKEANELCSKYTAVANEKASAIIYKVAQACKVNPQVLLTILQKEQSLVTSTTATSAMYRAATGYSCPDNASCNPAYAGFFMQVISAARQLHLPSSSYPVGVASTIAYNPNSACGSISLTIRNMATAALYTYTPYAANPVLLAGKADSCSVAGNVNLVKIFTGWFGNPVLTQSVKSYVHAAYQDVLGRTVSDAEVARQTRSIMNGTSRDTLSFSFLSSTEYRKKFVSDTYATYLGRPAETSGVNNWVAKMATGTANQDDLPATFMATPEYYKRSGSTAKGYVTALYWTVLKHGPDAGGLKRWVAQVQASPNGRATVALGIWRSNASSKIRTNQAYQDFLGDTRVARDSEQQAWATKIAKTGYYKAVAGIIASSEFLNNAVKRYPQAQ